MAFVYAKLDAFPAFQEKLEATVRGLEQEAQSREEQITQTVSILTARVETARRAEDAAQTALQNAQAALSEAEQRTSAYNSNLGEDESPMTTPSFFYESVADASIDCCCAQARRQNAEDTLESFRTYARNHRAGQEAAVDAYKKLLTRSGVFFKKYMALLIAAKKYTALASAAGGGKDGQAKDGQGKGGYVSPYVKGSYTGTVSYRDPDTKQKKTVTLERTVYRNRNIDPFLVVPAGTPIGRKRVLDRDMTNLELMERNHAPFVRVKDRSGNEILSPVIVHHVTGQETLHGRRNSAGKKPDGTVAEVPAVLHQRYDRVLHIYTGRGSSFRTRKQLDPVLGKRVKVSTGDNRKYMRFLGRYWKDRAAEIRAEMGLKP